MLGRSVPDQDTHGRWVEAIAGVVDLRTVGENAEQIHLRPQINEIARFRDAIDDREIAIGFDRHVHEEIDVADDVAFAEAVTAERCQKVFAARAHELGLMPEADAVALTAATTGGTVMPTAAVARDRQHQRALVRQQLGAKTEISVVLGA